MTLNSFYFGRVDHLPDYNMERWEELCLRRGDSGCNRNYSLFMSTDLVQMQKTQIRRIPSKQQMILW